jgi:hypothetical protein
VIITSVQEIGGPEISTERNLNFIGDDNYLLVEVCCNTKNDTEKDDINAEVATGSHLIASKWREEI